MNSFVGAAILFSCSASHVPRFRISCSTCCMFHTLCLTLRISILRMSHYILRSILRITIFISASNFMSLVLYFIYSTSHGYTTIPQVEFHSPLNPIEREPSLQTSAKNCYPTKEMNFIYVMQNSLRYSRGRKLKYTIFVDTMLRLLSFLLAILKRKKCKEIFFLA